MQSLAVAAFCVFGMIREVVSRRSLQMQWPAQALGNELRARGLSLAARSGATAYPAGRAPDGSAEPARD